MTYRMIRHVAFRFLARQYERPQYDLGRLTRMHAEDFPLEVPEMRFQQALAKFARSLRGTYRDGDVVLPVSPHRLTALYQKWYEIDGPRVAFVIYPTKKGNRSKMYRMFEGPVQGSGRLFQRFITWLGVLGSAIQEHAYGNSPMAQKFRNLSLRKASSKRVAKAFLQGLRKATELDDAVIKWLAARAQKKKASCR